MRRIRSRIAFVAALAAVGLVALQATSCGGGGTPSSATPPTTVKPTPTPTPPSGGGGGGSSSCPLGNGDPSAVCDTNSPRLIGSIYAAQDLLVQQKPQIFDTTKESGTGTGQYMVLDAEAYLNGLVANLIAAGFCAQRNPDDYSYQQIQLKNTKDFSETYDVLSSGGYMRRSKGIYLETCTPASFPVDRTGLPPIGSGCGIPYPPPITHMTCKIYSYGSDHYQLDSTAKVGPDVNYCASIGYTDGRSDCPVRKDGAPDKAACEEWDVGYAKDTGQPGPTWTNSNGDYCTGPASGCANYPGNQFELWVYTSGTYTVCAKTGSCCSIIVEK